uniref:2Fe-2S ferredoxin-type domain-containing protein n=1 Tax=Aureoumbra lagunensis TaxID=44058 RepID=A0A7S3JZW0_9STRA|mmetsp:Transcript_20858/g.27041  ORF Transcript_20858/g.27041 Transcript_20858/m.27041 type:complete len:159 (-) Transcript_20858:34-510(-)
MSQQFGISMILRRGLNCINKSGTLRKFSHSHSHAHLANAEDVQINWLLKKTGERIITRAKVGENVLRLAQRYDIPLEGACEGVAACSTCHCIFENELYDSFEEASEKEEDMLDQAFGLTVTSRLACQLTVEKHFDGTTISLPEATRNFYVDGHVPKPH